jgi:cytochrome P450
VLIAQFPLLYKFVMALTPCSIIEHAEDVVRVKNKTHLNSAPADSLLALATNRASAPMSTLEIEANLVILINAGSETLSGSLCATTYYLAQNKACAKKAREEVRAAFAKESDICQPLVTELPYLNAVIIEAFRLFPAVPNSIPREATANVMIDGIRKAESTSKLLCSISERINTFVFMLFGFGRDQQTLKCQLNVSKLCAQSR